MFGYAALVDAAVLVACSKKLKSRPQSRGDWGLAKVISLHTKLVDNVEDDLTMEGLKILFKRNIPSKKKQ